MAALIALERAVPVLQMADSQDILLNNRMKTNAPLTALPHFLANVHTVAPSEEMRWKAEHIRARLTENLHIIKCRRLKD